MKMNSKVNRMFYVALIDMFSGDIGELLPFLRQWPYLPYSFNSQNSKSCRSAIKFLEKYRHIDG